MQVSAIRNSSFYGNAKQQKENKNSKNIALGVLTYATTLAVFPHDYEKLVSNIDIDFKNLPIKDKAKNIGKFALPFFCYPAILLGGLFGISKLVQKCQQNKTDKDKESENLLEKNKENIKKYGNIFHAGLMASSLLYAGSKIIKTASKDISKQKELIENIKIGSATTVFLAAFLTFIPKFNDYIDKKLNSTNYKKTI